MSWTDEELKEKQVRCEKSAEKWEAQRSKGMAASNRRVADLHRLARLGLAAEQVGRDVLSAAETFEECVNDEMRPALTAFLTHEAWRK